MGGNAQQYLHENLAEGATIGAEKIVITQSPGAIGTRIVQRFLGGWQLATVLDLSQPAQGYLVLRNWRVQP